MLNLTLYGVSRLGIPNIVLGVIPVEDFAWTRGGPADHWGLGPQVTAKLGGRKLVLGEAARAALRETPPRVEIGYDAWVSPEPGVMGWFDFRETIRVQGSEK